MHVTLEVARTFNAERHNTDIKGWEPVASTQAKTKEEAKALMLDNVLEMLNDENMEPTDSWFRLVYRTETKEVETF